LILVSILEIGAGSGINLYFFKKMGIKWENIHANELLDDRIIQLKENFPIIKIYEGDARDIFPDEESKFDIIFNRQFLHPFWIIMLKRSLLIKCGHFSNPVALFYGTILFMIIRKIKMLRALESLNFRIIS